MYNANGSYVGSNGILPYSNNSNGYQTYNGMYGSPYQSYNGGNATTNWPSYYGGSLTTYSPYNGGMSAANSGNGYQANNSSYGWYSSTYTPYYGGGYSSTYGIMSASSSGNSYQNYNSSSSSNVWLLSQGSAYPLHCAYISAAAYTTGRWYSQDCWSSYSFVCEKAYYAPSQQSATLNNGYGAVTSAPWPATTTCSPFGVAANCVAANLSAFGVSVQERGACLVLAGVDWRSSPLPWSNAVNSCGQMGGNLVKVADTARFQTVNNLAAIAAYRSGVAGVWTGLQNTQNLYRWPDGTFNSCSLLIRAITSTCTVLPVQRVCYT